MEQISQVSPTLHQAVVTLRELSADEEAQEAARIQENAYRLRLTIENVARNEGIKQGIEQTAKNLWLFSGFGLLRKI